MDTYTSLAQEIIRHQESVIGPLAWGEAAKVNGIHGTEKKKVAIQGDGKKVLGDLVSQFEKLFGQASVEACKDAIRPVLPQLDSVSLPDILL